MHISIQAHQTACCSLYGLPKLGTQQQNISIYGRRNVEIQLLGAQFQVEPNSIFEPQKYDSGTLKDFEIVHLKVKVPHFCARGLIRRVHVQVAWCESERQAAQLVHLLLPYDPLLHLQTAQISVRQLLRSLKPISDLVSTSVQSVRSARAT